MKKKSFDEKVKDKYGLGPSEISTLSTSRLKELKLHNKVEKKLGDKFKLVKKPIATITKGGMLGAGVAGAIDTAFPNIIPVVGSALTQASEMTAIEKALSFTALASKPTEVISGLTIVGAGAVVGAVLYTGYTIVKSGAEHFAIVNDRNKAKKLSKK